MTSARLANFAHKTGIRTKCPSLNCNNLTLNNMECEDCLALWDDFEIQISTLAKPYEGPLDAILVSTQGRFPRAVIVMTILASAAMIAGATYAFLVP